MACKPPSDNEAYRPNKNEGEMDIDDFEDDFEIGSSGSTPFSIQTAAVQSSKGGRGGVKLTLLPPPLSRSDLLSIVDIGRAAEILLLIVPGSESQGDTIDKDGEEALAVLRALGLPEIVLAVQSERQGGGAQDQSNAGTSAVKMKERSAAKKRAEKAIASQIAGDHRLFHVDTTTDLTQLVRHISEHTPVLPVWRRSRPSVMVEGAQYEPSGEGAVDSGTLMLTGYVRSAGLSANQLIHIQGAGDFQIDKIVAAQEDAAVGTGAGGMDTSGGPPRILATHDPEEQESLVRVNVPDPGDEEQTWPSEKELLDVEQLLKAQVRRRKLPEGTSEYQAAWILDDDEEEGEEEEEEEEQEGQDAMEDDEDEAPDLPPVAATADDEEEEDGIAVDDEEADDEAGVQGGRAAREALRRELRDRHRREEEEKEQQDFPDEVEVPDDVAARIRFQKYKGLKSFRSSPWDSKEWLPKEYANVFAFENFKRAHKRAKEAVERATEGLDPCSVPPGSYVTIHVSAVPSRLAASVVSRIHMSKDASTSSPRPPMVAFGLMQHEGRMSVLHAGIKKAAAFEAPIANKEELMIVTGVRTFTSTPVLSADTPGDKQKMERFLHAGRYSVASVFAPISYGPLPFLAFKPQGSIISEGCPRVKLAACGSVRSCDPDRVVLKKITLTGFPVRVHKRRATVKFMFYNPDDIRWFRPIELYTKYGRRGTIEEPIGTHGAMKCMFDAPVQQRDAVCMSLYKRVFPKWPQSLDFA